MSRYEYGRYLDFKDVALTPPKFKRPTGFTETFLTGPYADTSLTSIDKRLVSLNGIEFIFVSYGITSHLYSKERAESWQKRVSERKKQMEEKYEELQKVS